MAKQSNKKEFHAWMKMFKHELHIAFTPAPKVKISLHHVARSEMDRAKINHYEQR